MDTENELLQHYHRDHKRWIQKIEFYLHEIEVFKKELQVVLYKNPNSYSTIEHVEEYIKILMLKKEDLFKMLDEIKFHERDFADGLETEEVRAWEHMKIKEKCKVFESNFEKLKIAFRRFVAHKIDGVSSAEARNHLKH